MKARDLHRGLTAEYLREMVDYDPRTGKFCWKQSNNQVTVGTEAGNFVPSLGYMRLMIKGHHYLLHRLAWLHHFGKWPKDPVDHRNLNRCDNRIVNLREASHAGNSANQAVKKTNFLGIKGVRLHECGRYTARIGFQGKIIYLGLFDSPEEASSAYAMKAAELYGEF